MPDKKKLDGDTDKKSPDKDKTDSDKDKTDEEKKDQHVSEIAATSAYIATQDAKSPSPDVNVILAHINAVPGMKIPGKPYKADKNPKGEGHYDIYFNPDIYKDYTEGDATKSNKIIEKDEFPNQLEDQLQQELNQAKRLGVKPISPSNATEFDEVINQGPIKWVVNQDGELKVMEKFKQGEELKHPVLSNGNPVLAAGEAEIGGNSVNGYFMLEFNNNSGHFLPSSNSLELGKTKFKEIINILNNF